MKKITALYILALFLLTGCFSNKHIRLTKGLAAYYPFNGNANDCSKNNPVFNNATLTADRFGHTNSAYHFNGIDNFMQIQNISAINPHKEISICVWVRPTGFYYGTCHSNRIIMKGDGDYTSGNYTIAFDEAIYSPETACGAPLTDTIHQNFRCIADAKPYLPYIIKNEWISIIFTCDQKTTRLYINGQLKSLVNLTSKITFKNQCDLFFGRLNDATFPYWYNGDLDEVRIYNRAINELEIMKIAAGVN
jgi:hypothetical protein